MNRLLITFSIAFVLSAINAHGMVLPSWERPIFESQLVELDADGHEMGIGLKKELTMNQEDGVGHPTSLRLQEERQVECFTTPCNPILENSVFTVQSISHFHNGSTRYMAREIVPANALRPARQLELIAHDPRICDDYKQYLWEVKLTEANKVRDLYGNPEVVETVQATLPINTIAQIE